MPWKALIVIAVMACAARAGAAQGFENGPRGSIFGVANGGARDRLEVTAALSETYDKEPPPELRPLIQQNNVSGGFSSMMTGAAQYERNRRKVDLSAQAFTALQYYPRLDQVVPLTHSAGIGATVQTSRRSSLELTQTGSFSPSYLYQLFPTVGVPGVGDTVPAAPDYRVDDFQSFSYATRVTARAGRSRGYEVSATVEHNVTDYLGATDRPDLDTIEGTLTLGYGVGRTGVVSIQYQYREGEFGYGGGTIEQRIGISANYSPALSGTRRVQLRLTVSPSAIDMPDSALGVEATGTLYRMEAEASAEYPFLRTWSIGGAYNRGLEYIPVFRQPVFRSATRVETSGLVSQRMEISASAGYVAGESILQRESELLDSYTGTIRARYTVNRSLAVYGQYLYYYYDLRGQTGLAPDLSPSFEQHGLRLGLMLWARPVSR